MGQATIIDVNNVAVTAGALSVTGFATGEAISHAYDGDDYEGVQGTHGEVSVIRKHNNLGTVTLRLMQGNVLNSLLKDLHKASLLAGSQSFPFMIKDLLGTSLINSQQALIMKYPDEKWGDSENPREWVLKTFNPVTIGGLNVIA